MPIRYFSFPLPETRFFQAEQHVYKFKIRVGSNCSEVDMIGEQFVNEELENAIRAVLANLNCLQPFTTTHFTIYPYKSKWMRVSELRFEKLSGEKLLAYPYLITLYLETNTQTAKCVEATQTASLPEAKPKCSRTEQPHRGTTIPQNRCSDNLTMQGPHLKINEELLRQRKTKSVDDKTEWVISASLNPQSAVGSSVTDGSEAKGVTRNHEDKELHYGTVEESDLEEPNLSPDLDPKPSVRSGVLARFVSQVFPFSMFYNKN
uniref:Membrane-anchored junction protein n=1 Tax=Esox lucius TaxID=8010 RepID=A0A3P8ZZE7_ESOLU